MSTLAFQRFSEQLTAKDWVKADGYDLAWFDQMSLDELHKAEDLLLEQASTGDMSTLQPLAKIGTSKAIDFLRRAFIEKDYRSDSGVDYQLANYLWSLTGDNIYLKTFDRINIKDDNKLLRLIPVIANLPNKKTRIEQLLEIIKERDDGVVKFQASKEILRLINILNENCSNLEDYRPLLNDIKSNSFVSREKGINELCDLIASYNKS